MNSGSMAGISRQSKRLNLKVTAPVRVASRVSDPSSAKPSARPFPRDLCFLPGLPSVNTLSAPGQVSAMKARVSRIGRMIQKFAL